jgi:VCBS repeat protein
MVAKLRTIPVLAFLGISSGLVFAGQFLQVVTYRLPDNPVFVTTGDFNGDGIPDLATSNQTDHATASVSILLGNGDGAFQPAKTYAGGGDRGIAVADLNRDGKLDLVLDAGGNIAVLIGRGDGTFQKPVYYPVTTLSYGLAAADFNADGKVDVVITDQYRAGVDVLLGNGDGTLQAPMASGVLGSFPSHVVVADFNGDGKPDISTTNLGDYTVAVALGNGDGTFQPAVTYSLGVPPSRVVAADFNRDGKLDIVTSIAGEMVYFPGNGDGTFGQMIESQLNALRPYIAGAGDFDHNGRLDVAVAHKGPDLELELGAGNGSFRDSGPYALGSDALNGAVADFNRDGWPDVVVPGFNARNVSVLINKGKTGN